VNEQDLLELFEDRFVEPIFVCHIERPLADVLGSLTNTVVLSASTIEKQQQEHPELGIDEYLRLPTILSSGLAYQHQLTRIRFVYHSSKAGHHGYQAVIKRTEDRRELFVISFHRMRPRKIMALAGRPLIIRQLYS